MSTTYLLLLDTAGIQPFIFGTNRVREQVGASYLVKEATTTWAFEAVVKVFGEAHNLDLAGGILNRDRRLGESGVEAEVLYAAGGNLMMLASGEGRLDEVVRNLSRRVLLEAPGLPVVAARVPIDLTADALPTKVDDAFRALFEMKRAAAPTSELLGVGVTRAGQSTGLPAVEMVQTVRDDPASRAHVSAATLAKRAVFFDATAALESAIRISDYGFVYPRELDDLGRSEGEMSYIAVVHADGNGVGQRIRAVGKDVLENDKAPMAEKNRQYIGQLRSFSRALEAAALAAQNDVFQGLARSVDRESGTLVYTIRTAEDGADGRSVQNEVLRIPLREARRSDRPAGAAENERYWYLPVRPLVFGGDDLTFVAEGRLGLAMALHYLRRFEHFTTNGVRAGDREKTDAVGRLTASAGVAIVKSHYPFSRAYGLAEELVGSAKSLRRKARRLTRRDDWDDSCLDWHVAMGGLAGSLDLIRRREYEFVERIGERKPLALCLRPLVVDGRLPTRGPIGDLSEAQQWAVVEQAIEGFRGSGWIGRRNKLKRLREVLREGREEVRRFTEAVDSLPGLAALEDVVGSGDASRDGWADGYRCAYFDAIELLDLYFPEDQLFMRHDD